MHVLRWLLPPEEDLQKKRAHHVQIAPHLCPNDVQTLRVGKFPNISLKFILSGRFYSVNLTKQQHNFLIKKYSLQCPFFFIAVYLKWK